MHLEPELSGSEATKQFFPEPVGRVLLTLARVPLPQIGSFMICDDGVLCLVSRPVSLEMQDLGK